MDWYVGHSTGETTTLKSFGSLIKRLFILFKESKTLLYCDRAKGISAFCSKESLKYSRAEATIFLASALA